MGVKQWVFQRLSNVAIIVFGFWLVYFLASPGAITAETIMIYLAIRHRLFI